MTKIAINGAAGRMGLRLVDLIHRDPDLQIVAAVDSQNHPSIGMDVGLMAGTGELGIVLTDQISSMPKSSLISRNLKGRNRR